MSETLPKLDAAHSLDRVQQWMLAVISHPFGTEAGLASDAARQAIDLPPRDVEQVVSPSRALSSIERLDVYANAYYARLLECLRVEFPVLVRTVGLDAFDQFALAYLQRYPSRSYTLGQLGKDFARFLAETRPQREGDTAGADWADFLVDLARLEWAFNEVFDGPGIENESTLTPDQLLALGPERWSRARLRCAPCLRVIAFRYPVNGYFTDVRRGETPPLPTPADSWLAVTRRNYIVRRHELSEPQYHILSALLVGQPVDQALAAAAPAEDAQLNAFAHNLRLWFAHWAAEGFFLAVDG
jgi:hypothetical protein